MIAYNPITDLTAILFRSLDGYRITVLDGDRVISRHTCPDRESGQEMLETVIQPKGGAICLNTG